MVSVVDLRYMLEDHCLSACPFPLLVSSVGELIVLSVVLKMGSSAILQ